MIAKPGEDRSRIMRAVRSQNTGPEIIVRKWLHGQGYRYRLHRKDLPGHPDIVFPGRRKIIFVHGCFWHGHHCPRGDRQPRANAEYWKAKIARNVARDQEQRVSLEAQGWKVMIVWECGTRPARREELAKQFTSFLEGDRA